MELAFAVMKPRLGPTTMLSILNHLAPAQYLSSRPYVPRLWSDRVLMWQQLATTTPPKQARPHKHYPAG